MPNWLRKGLFLLPHTPLPTEPGAALITQRTDGKSSSHIRVGSSVRPTLTTGSTSSGSGSTDLVRLAVGVEEGQAVETLVVLREAAEAEEQSTDTHVHQHPPLI